MSNSEEASTGTSARVSNTSRTKKTTTAISSLKFPFELTKDQVEAVDAWISNGYRGSIIYSTGTGKTEIAFECAKRGAEATLQIDGDSIHSENNNSHTNNHKPCFNILFLVPRIILIEQNIKRLLKYGISKEKIGAYFGERKEVREITISTYQSVINKLDLIFEANMIVFDEVHLVSDTATTLRKLFDVVIARDNAYKKQLLGLTATIDEQDAKYSTILSLLPPVKRYMINDAVRDKRLAKPVVIPIKTNLTFQEKNKYEQYSTRIRNISNYLNTSDPKSITFLLRKGGYVSGVAKSWFAIVKERKNLINCAENKLLAAASLIEQRHPSERVMIFSETIESIEKLKKLLLHRGIKSMVIDSKLKSKERQEILSEWGKEFFPLLSVHTLEIGYDVPDVRVAIILATTSNIHQIVQRIGRIVRKAEGKDTALIYTIFLSHTHDTNTLAMVRQATNMENQSVQHDTLDNYIF
ncbi:MAG: DEAD/DEAH box helicase [Nitrososphaeraceae archaeon]